MSAIEWLPLESNPDIMNRFLVKLGVPKKWGISDIVSLDEELLNLVPTPVYAVLLLFPFSEADNEYCKKQEEIAKSAGKKTDENLYFMNQTIVNGCGVVALIHAIANNMVNLDLPSDSIIKKFIDETNALSPKRKSEVLELKSEISLALKESFEGGCSLCTKCEFHFIILIQLNSKLYELDGRKTAPVFHGSTSNETFLKDALRIFREYMERDSQNINFNALAFGAV